MHFLSAASEGWLVLYRGLMHPPPWVGVRCGALRRGRLHARTDFVVKYYSEDERTGTLVEQGEFEVHGLEFVEEEEAGVGAAAGEELALTFEAFQRNKRRRRRFSVRACAELALSDPLVEMVEWRKVRAAVTAPAVHHRKAHVGGSLGGHQRCAQQLAPSRKYIARALTS